MIVRYALGLILFLLCSTSTYSSIIVTHAGKESNSEKDVRAKYYVDVLHLALSYFPGKYEVRSDQKNSPQSRKFIKIKKEENGPDVLWSMTTKERESGTLAVKVPIDFGFIGYRVLLINKEDKDLFKNVSTISDLKKYSFGLMRDWPDYKIFEINGQKVFSGANYEGLFKMLKARRFNGFPRAVTEVSAEAKSHLDDGLIIEPHLIIQYPSAFYFFVKKNKAELHKDVETGLLKALEDGKLKNLFMTYYQEDLKKLNLQERKIIRFDNPLLSEDFPIDRKDFWFNFSFEKF